MVNEESGVIRAFGTDHIARLTGLSEGQLRSWDRTGLFCPQYAYENRHNPYSRVYSFRDAVALKTIAILLNKYKVSVQQLRKVAQKLDKLGFNHWSDVKLYVLKGQVHFQKPGTTEIEGISDGQLAMLPIIDVINDVEKNVRTLQTRTEDQYGKIEKHRHVARNATVVAGTRIPTATIRRFIDSGYSIDEVLQEYPALTKEDVFAAISHEKRVA